MKKKNRNVLWVILAIIGVIGLFIWLGGRGEVTAEEGEGMISITTYRCDEETFRCQILGENLPLAIIGPPTDQSLQQEGVTHFSLKVTADVKTLRDINNFRIMDPTETPGTTVSAGGAVGVGSFYEALVNEAGSATADPIQSGPVPVGGSFVWDTKNCIEPSSSSSSSKCGAAGGKINCINLGSSIDCNDGEQCMETGNGQYCLLMASMFVDQSPDDIYTFTAALEGEYTTSQGTLRTVTNEGNLDLLIAPDLEGRDIYTIKVEQSSMI